MYIHIYGVTHMNYILRVMSHIVHAACISHATHLNNGSEPRDTYNQSMCGTPESFLHQKES